MVKRTDELFNRNCARCHGADGRGNTPLGQENAAPDFTDPTWWKRNVKLTTTRAMRAAIVNGKDRMPAFGKKLTRSEVSLLIGRVRAFKKSK